MTTLQRCSNYALIMLLANGLIQSLNSLLAIVSGGRLDGATKGKQGNPIDAIMSNENIYVDEKVPASATTPTTTSITTDVSTTSPPPKIPTSPKSLALRGQEALEGLDLDKRLRESKIQQVEEELVHVDGQFLALIPFVAGADLNNAVRHSYDQKKRELLESIRMEKEAIGAIEQRKSEKLGKITKQLQEQDVQEQKKMADASLRFGSIVLRDPLEERSLKTFTSFGDLWTRVEQLYPAQDVRLYRSGTKAVVGSQFELLAAYVNAPMDATELVLDVKIGSKKRKAEEAGMDDSAVLPPGSVNTGPWNELEVELFKAGLDQCGWGSWVDVANLVRTRSAEQCYDFSRRRGASFKPSPNPLVYLMEKFASAHSNFSEALVPAMELLRKQEEDAHAQTDVAENLQQ